MKVRSFDCSETQLLTCEQWMSRAVRAVNPYDSIAHSRATLQKYRINQLPVVKDGLLVGIATDRDLRNAVNTVRTVQVEGTGDPDPQRGEEIPVEAVMTQDVISLAPRSTLVKAAMVMLRRRISSLPIVDGGRLAGLLTRSDILKAFVVTQQRECERAGQP